MNKGEFVNGKYKFPIFTGIDGIMAPYYYKGGLEWAV